MKILPEQRMAKHGSQRSLFKLGPVATGCALLLLASGSVLAQQASTSTDLSTVTVTGIRKGIEAAISVKKNSDSIVEAISAEDIGKLPDSSIAESMARLPGLTAQRTQGRAQQISIRGMSPDFSTALLNGREQVTTGDSRGVEFDQYPSELLSGVVVYKTPDGGLVGQGLSGTVDLQTVRPLDFAKRTLAVNYRKQRSGIDTGMAEGNGQRLNFSYIDQFADRTVGVALGFARLSETGATTSRFDSWGGGSAKVNGVGADVNVPYNGFGWFADQTTQTREGAMAVLQFKPTKDFSSTVDLFHSSFDKVKATKGFQAPLNDSWVSGFNYDKAGVLTSATLNGKDATAGVFNNVRGVVRNDSESTQDTLSSYGWNSKLKMGEWTGALDLATSKAVRRGGIMETTAGTAQAALGTAALDTLTFNNAQGFTPGFNYGDRSIIKLTDVQGWGGGVGSPQAGYSKLPHVEDKLDSFRLSGKRNLPDGWFLSALDVGMNVSDRAKTREFIEGRLVIRGGNPLGAADMPGTSTTTVAGINVATFNPVGTIGSIYDVVPKLHPDIFNKDWTVKEKVTTLYSRGDIDSKLFGLPVRGNIGLQYVKTDQSSTAFNVDRDASSCISDQNCPAATSTVGTSYNDVLPSTNLVFDIGGDQTLRVGLARQMARPTLNDMRASFSFSYDATKGIYTGDGGNPNLKPFRANALDVSYEKYFGTKAYVGVAGFYKDLGTYIVNIADPIYNFSSYVNGNTPVAPTPIGQFTRPFNGSGGSIKGIELSASLPFNLLAKQLDGFGTVATYSNTSSSVNLPTSGVSNDGITTGTIPLPGLSKVVSSLAVYYEANGFSARVAQRRRSAFVGEVTNFAGDRQLTYIDGEAINDLQLGYEFQSGPAKGLSIMFQANNLSNAQFVRYKDVPTNIIEKTTYGKTYLFGMNYKY